jgi:hypothetical protein
MNQDLLLGSRLLQLKIEDSNLPFFLGRLGSVEAEVLSFPQAKENLLSKLKYSVRLRKEAWISAGIWPPTSKQLKVFKNEFESSIQAATMLAEWPDNSLPIQKKIFEKFSRNTLRIPLGVLDPIFLAAEDITPWTNSFGNKRILVVSSFAEEILIQYSKLEVLHQKKIMPNFTLTTIRPPQTNGLKISFFSWEKHLRKFQTKLFSQIERDKPDLVLVSAGSYGMPICKFLLANKISSIYVGGALQLYFGIWGSRWRNSTHVLSMATENWIWPDRKTRPFGATFVENSAYW